MSTLQARYDDMFDQLFNPFIKVRYGVSASIRRFHESIVSASDESRVRFPVPEENDLFAFLCVLFFLPTL